ncbi:MAG: LysM peptidoglycan-binding domain-containing protein [Kiritimatiellae bacterium]|nr:LysM peptidoglycan-binding domain-containing protein [Kiritimatiellia bacterium]
MNLTDNSELSAQLESALADLEKTKAEAESLRKETESLRRELAVEKKQSGERRRVLDSLAGLDDDGEAVKVSSAASSDDDSGAPAVASIPSVDDGSASPGVSSLPSEEDAGARPGVRTIPSELLDDGGGPLVLNPEAAALNDEAEAEESSLLPRRETVVGGSRLSDFGKSRGEEESAPAATTYVVQEGDTLMKIAKKHYGRKSAWTRIRDANRTTLTGDTIRPGQILKLP